MALFNKTFLFLLLFFFPIISYSQFNRVGGGLSFSSGVDFNNGTTGNPAIHLRGYYKLKDRLYVIPSLTAFNRFNKADFSYSLTSYMFHMDIDGQYGIFKEDQVVIYGMAGINATTLISRFESHINIGGNQPENNSSIKPGLNLGGGLKLYINRSYDGFLQVKYIAGGFSQFVISLGGIYHFDGNNRKTW